MQRSTLLHLRIPFSFFLLPVFLFALSISNSVTWFSGAIVFVALHFFIYPASNAYNSYFDKDEGSIGGLKEPPKVTKELYWVALLFDTVGIILAAILSVELAALMFVYGLVSKAYSHPSVRLKKMPIAGWLTAGIFQGYFTFLMCIVGFDGGIAGDLFDIKIQIPAILSSFLLLGSYPMTQIYQHEEDGKRGDETISRKLGILGTFHFTALFFAFSCLGFVMFYYQYYSLGVAVSFQLSLTPILGFFAWWYFKVRGDRTKADFQNTMRLNLISSLVLNLYFLSTAVLFIN